MSDFNSSLPIRTESAGDAIVKIADATTPSQQLKVESDGSINVNATDLDVRDLVFATDKVDVTGSEVSLDATTLAALESITVQNGAGASAVNVQDGGNSLTVDATDLDIRDIDFATDSIDVSGSEVSLDATTLAALESVTVQNAGGGAAVNIQDGGNSLTVDAVDLDIRDLSHVSDSVKVGDGTDFLAINSDGSINVVPLEDPGTETVSYNTAASIAAGATSNHDTLFASASRLFQVWVSGSAKVKAEVQVETGSATGVFNTVMVGFSSTANPNIDLRFAKFAVVPAGARVRVIRTNRDNQAQDLYSTTIGILG